MKFFAWISDHLQLIAWPTVCVFIWKLRGVLVEYRDRFKKAETTVELLATNHLPHLQTELEKINGGIKDGFDRMSDGFTAMRQDLIILLNNRKD
jgi:hypothetical protein